jgi:hypothetical protein
MQPVPMRREQAKVYLDRECLMDGQDWLAGFIQVYVCARRCMNVCVCVCVCVYVGVCILVGNV